MHRTIDAASLQQWLHDGQELAVLDVREHGQYGASHLYAGVWIAYSRLEADISRFVPRRDTRVVLYDSGNDEVDPDSNTAGRAAAALLAAGYTDVHVLDGGTRGWAAAGFVLFAGVNVPSKSFGELVELACHTPRVTALRLKEMLASDMDIVVLDGRPFAEYRKMNIPGSICCPNGELAYRIKKLVPDPGTTIVMNCAGRTRSIIGAQTLIDLGVPNPVFALQDGTQGWYLEDQALAHGSTARYPAIDADDPLPLADAARALSDKYRVRSIGIDELTAWRNDPSRTCYLLDVRTREEYDAGHFAGADHAPGGQLIQATDQWIAVRRARVVVVDRENVRAPVIATWLKRLGYDASVFVDHETKQDGQSDSKAGSNTAPVRAVDAFASIDTIDAATLRDAIAEPDASCLVLDLRSSMRYRAGHVPGSRWTTRCRLLTCIAAAPAAKIILVDDDADVARIAAHDIAAYDGRPVQRLVSYGSWADAGFAEEKTPSDPPDEACIDYLFFVHDRHDGNKAAARQYLAWEKGLVAQLHPNDVAVFQITPPTVQSSSSALPSLSALSHSAS